MKHERTDEATNRSGSEWATPQLSYIGNLIDVVQGGGNAFGKTFTLGGDPGVDPRKEKGNV